MTNLVTSTKLALFLFICASFPLSSSAVAMDAALDDRDFGEVPISAYAISDIEIVIKANTTGASFRLGNWDYYSKTSLPEHTPGKSDPKCVTMAPFNSNTYYLAGALAFKRYKESTIEGGYLVFSPKKISANDQIIKKGEKLRVVSSKTASFDFSLGRMLLTERCRADVAAGGYTRGEVELETESGLRFALSGWYFVFQGQIQGETFNYSSGIEGLTTEMAGNAIGLRFFKE